MSELTEILSAIDAGDLGATERLLPLVYNELRMLAAAHLARERPGHTLQPTALVHEAYLRLLGGANPKRWNGRGHFFAAAAAAIRRILVQNARSKRRLKRGGDRVRQELDDQTFTLPEPREDLLALDEALEKLATTEPQAAETLQLLYFGGLTIPETARVLKVSQSTVSRRAAFARAWLRCELKET